MTSDLNNDGSRPVWFVGAAFGGNQDQLPRFLSNGIWENGHADHYIEEVKSILPGDKIAVKAAYTRKNGLPFDNRGHAVSVMAIKAVGTVLVNGGDGRHLIVDWTPVTPFREWYFYTYRGTVWRVLPEPTDWRAVSLARFTFNGENQNIDRFRNDPYWRAKFGDMEESESLVEVEQPEIQQPSSTILEYTIDNIVQDGCFIERSDLENALECLASKKNLILQGPPGTGKTWLAKKLAFALIGRKDVDSVRSFQFHPNLSYEDFVRGWRPDGARGGRLSLVDGPFLQMVEDALQDTENKYVMVIEEINRGNPAHILGEMLTLLEADKRDPQEALSLGYPKGPNERVHIPPNVYLIGTMNVADRSLALVDLALRRRFAFVDLKPIFGERWQDWVYQNCEVETDFLSEIEKRLESLNSVISDDPSLGSQFRVGHSFFTPSPGTQIDTKWFRQVVETEIGPLLDEYWFGDVEKASTQKQRLLDGL